MAYGVWKGVQPQILGRSRQLSPNKIFDLGTPSMRKGCDGEKKKKWKKKRIVKIAAYCRRASQLPER